MMMTRIMITVWWQWLRLRLHHYCDGDLDRCSGDWYTHVNPASCDDDDTKTCHRKSLVCWNFCWRSSCQGGGWMGRQHQACWKESSSCQNQMSANQTSAKLPFQTPSTFHGSKDYKFRQFPLERVVLLNVERSPQWGSQTSESRSQGRRHSWD